MSSYVYKKNTKLKAKGICSDNIESIIGMLFYHMDSKKKDFGNILQNILNWTLKETKLKNLYNEIIKLFDELIQSNKFNEHKLYSQINERLKNYCLNNLVKFDTEWKQKKNEYLKDESSKEKKDEYWKMEMDGYTTPAMDSYDTAPETTDEIEKKIRKKYYDTSLDTLKNIKKELEPHIQDHPKELQGKKQFDVIRQLIKEKPFTSQEGGIINIANHITKLEISKRGGLKKLEHFILNNYFTD